MGMHCVVKILTLVLAKIALVSGTPVTKTVVAPIETIVGLQQPGGYIFQGIPFAKPPCRWRDPEYPNNFEEPFIAYGDVNQVQCPQSPCGDDSPVCLSRISEDCLYLNMFVPLSATCDSKLPVMVHIHGGGFGIGSGLLPGYTGEFLAGYGNVIVVSINYRLGVLGFLATGKGKQDLKGNYGIKDQKIALYWIKQNIASFGGDPDKVTLFGQSAGAQSIGVHLSNTEGYFDRAIMQSAPFTIPFRTLDDAFVQTQFLAVALNCPNIVKRNKIISCIKSKSLSEIIKAQTFFERNAIRFTKSFLINKFQQWGPVIDDDIVPMNLMDAIKQNRFAKKKIMLGTTIEEAVYYIYGFRNPVPYIKVLSISRNLGVDHERVNQLYPPSNPLDARPEFAEIATDYLFLYSNRFAAEHLIKERKVWLYIYDHVLTNTTYWDISGFPFCRNKVCHSADVPVIFSNPIAYNLTSFFTPEETEMALSMIGYWTNFAKSENPNQPMEGFFSDYVNESWYRFRPNKRRNLVIGTTHNDLRPVDGEDFCNFYKTVN